MEAGAELQADGVLRSIKRSVRVGAFPIGIDGGHFARMARSPEADDMYATVRDEYSRRQFLVGVDRFDYSKGLPQRVQAFRELLERYPEIL